MSQALYRKWRPATFAEVVGQEHVTRTLQNGVAADRVSHAFLFSGPRGTGKTTTARLLAKAVNCLEPDLNRRPCDQCRVCVAIREGRFLDLIEIDAASNTGVDDIRDLREKINFAPSDGRYKVYIIDEVHMLSTAAFNALLKTLEEPPPHAKFVLATTEEHKVPATIRSRCQPFQFRLLSEAELQGRLRWLAEKEDLTIEPAALHLIARQGAGSMRDAESLLDQLVIAPGDTITLERAQRVLGTASMATVSGLTDAWLAGDGAAGLAIIHEALASGADARQLARQLVAYLRQLLLLQASGMLVAELPDEAEAAMAAQAERAPRAGLIAAIKAFNGAATSGAVSWQPQLPLELAFIELLPAPDDMSAPASERPRAKPAPPPTRPMPEAQAPAVPLSAAPTAVDAPPVDAPPATPARDGEADGARADAPLSPEATASEPLPAAAPAEPPPGDDLAAERLTLADLTTRWPDVMAVIKAQDRNLGALLNMARPLAVEADDTLVLGFEYPMLMDKFSDNPAATDHVLAALRENLGRRCRLRPVVSSQYAPPRLVTREEFGRLAEELGGVITDPDG